MVKSGLEFFIFKFTEPLQRYLLSCQANSAILGRCFCTGQQQLWSISKLISRLFRLKNENFKTRDFSPLIRRIITGVQRNQSNTKLGQISSKKDKDHSRFLEAPLIWQADGELKNYIWANNGQNSI